MIKILTPTDFILDALEKDFSTLELLQANVEIEKEFVKLLVLELGLSLFQVELYFGELAKVGVDEVTKIFEKGTNVEEKMVFFLKQEFETTLNDKDLKLLFLKIKRSGNQSFALQDLFLFPQLRIFKKVEIVEEIPQEPLQGIKLKETTLNMQVDVQPENLNNFFSDRKKSVF